MKHIDPVAWLARAQERFTRGAPWNAGNTSPAEPGWFDRCFTDGIYTHHWDGTVWRADLDHDPHWRQVGDYPCWRVAEHTGHTVTVPPHGWTCFHCGDHFPATRQGQEDALDHFGPTPETKPACIERTTLNHAEIMKRYRKTLKRNARLHRQCEQNIEAAEIAEHKAHGLEQKLKRFEGVDLTELRQRGRDFDTYMRALHRLNPEVFQALHHAVSGPGEYFPPDC